MNKEDKTLLELLGVKIEDKEILIDLKKTKETLQTIAKKLDSVSEKLKEGVKEGKIEIPTVGIDSNPKSFEIDLNQAKETLSSLAKKLSNLDNLQTQTTPKATLLFEVVSNRCDKDEIEKILGLESKSKKSWEISSSEFELNELKEISKKFIQFLTPKIDELKKIKRECKASLTLTLKLNSIPKEPITLSKEAIKFLNRVGGEFKFG